MCIIVFYEVLERPKFLVVFIHVCINLQCLLHLLQVQVKCDANENIVTLIVESS